MNKPFCKKALSCRPISVFHFLKVSSYSKYCLWPKWQAKTKHHSHGRPEVRSYHQITKTHNYSMLKWKFQDTGTLASSNWPINMCMLQDYITYWCVWQKSAPFTKYTWRSPNKSQEMTAIEYEIKRKLLVHVVIPVTYCGHSSWYTCFKILQKCRHSQLHQNQDLTTKFLWVLLQTILFFSE